MTALPVQFLGWVLSRIPDPVLSGFCGLSALVWRSLMPRRFATAVHNLRHAFPDRPDKWYLYTIRKSFERTVEMAVFALVSPFWSEKKLLERIKLSEATWGMVDRWRERPRPKIFLLPHVCLVESVAHTPLLLRSRNIDIGTIACIFRPLNQKGLDEWIRKSRERSGSRLLSRKRGFQEARSILKAGGGVGVLFDQRSGSTGTLIMSLGRVTSATDLPSLLAKEPDCDVCLVVPERQGFLRATLDCSAPISWETPEEVTLRSNRLWDEYLHGHPDRAAEWLWVHDRWRTHYKASQRLNLTQKRSLLDMQISEMGWDSLPRQTRFIFRMPGNIADFAAAFQLVLAAGRGRPDAGITLVGPAFGRWIAGKNLGLPLEYVHADGLFQRSDLKHADTLFLACPTSEMRGLADECRWLQPRQVIGPHCDKGEHKSCTFITDPVSFSANEAEWDHVPDVGKLRYFGAMGAAMGLDPAHFKVCRQNPDDPLKPGRGVEPDVFIQLASATVSIKLQHRLVADGRFRNVHNLRLSHPDHAGDSQLWDNVCRGLTGRNSILVTDAESWIPLAWLTGIRCVFIDRNPNPEGADSVHLFSAGSNCRTLRLKEPGADDAGHDVDRICHEVLTISELVCRS